MRKRKRKDPTNGRGDIVIKGEVYYCHNKTATILKVNPRSLYRDKFMLATLGVVEFKTLITRHLYYPAKKVDEVARKLEEIHSIK
jgi:hypothetical protein